MEKDSTPTPGKVDERIQEHLGKIVHGSAEDTLNALRSARAPLRSIRKVVRDPAFRFRSCRQSAEELPARNPFPQRLSKDLAGQKDSGPSGSRIWASCSEFENTASSPAGINACGLAHAM